MKCCGRVFFWISALLALVGAKSSLHAVCAGEAWPLGLEPDFSLPAHSPLNNETVALGKKLFYDPRLSFDQSISCASCHDPEQGFSNGRRLGTGIGGALGSRNVPTVLNRLLGRTQFWDGRAATLEDQALGPMFSPAEMGIDRELLLARLAADPEYQRRFQAAYGGPPSAALVAAAIASYERTLLTGGSPFDRYEWGGDQAALPPTAIRGLALFRGKARCNTCHTGTNFTDEKFHNLGVDLASRTPDPGLMAVTGQDQDRGKFKTPTLRNLSLTAPYMHDGSQATLQAVIEYYDRGCEPNPHLDQEIQPLGLDEAEKGDLLAFLESLTGAVLEIDPKEIAAFAN